MAPLSFGLLFQRRKSSLTIKKLYYLCLGENSQILKEMQLSAEALEFEKAAAFRDELKEIEILELEIS